MTREEIIADAEARIDRLAMQFADDVDIIADQVDIITGERPRISVAGRANFLAARWGIVEYHREQAQHLLAAIAELGPLMVGKPGRTVEAVLLTADQATAARIAADLEGAGLIRIEDGQLIPTPPE